MGLNLLQKGMTKGCCVVLVLFLFFLGEWNSLVDLNSFFIHFSHMTIKHEELSSYCIALCGHRFLFVFVLTRSNYAVTFSLR